jgi:ribosomal protein S17E
MIKLFRNIRKKLVLEKSSASSTKKYFKYAIGEIILVVIGILIALQINNWNEQRKQNNLEQEYLIALKTEFENNLKEVNRVLKLNEKILSNAQKLATYTGPNLPTIEEKYFAKLFFGTVNSEVQYRPGTGVVNEILNSGKLNVFKNKKLKTALASLDGMLLKIRFQENEELSANRYELIDLAKDNFSIRRMAFEAYGKMFGLDKGKFLDSNLPLLTLKKFDNSLTAFIYTSSYLDVRYKELKNQIQEIIAIIDWQSKK